MNIVNVNNANVSQNPHKVDARKIYDTKSAQVVHITLNPSESLKRHITPVDVFFYVLEGKGIVEIEDEQREVAPDTLVESPKKVPHCWCSKSNEILRILIVRVPRPTESARIL
ncbi:MAG: cupin domain-containing protein [Thermoplasmatales archaeon]|nr:cupin domain-containing protein [Thermoplasmatales archaeon]